MIELDGSMGEGGGQILRSSLTLSLLTGKPFRLFNIRAGRPKPGLQPQHLMSVRAAATVGKAQITGDRQGSRELVFEPGTVAGGNYRFDINTAGATGLVLQTIALPLLLEAGQPSEVIITGGTHTTTSPCFHFLDTTWRAYLTHLGVTMKLRIVRPGFYPRGGGEIRASLQPISQLGGYEPLVQEPLTIRGFSAVAGLPEHIAARQKRRAENRLRDRGLQSQLSEEVWDGGPGSVLAICLYTRPAPTLFFGLGARGKPAEAVADEAVDQVLKFVARREREDQQEVVDFHSADQLVLPLALSPQKSWYHVSEVTQHLLTNINVVRRFVDREIVCEGNEGEVGMVHIR